MVWFLLFIGLIIFAAIMQGNSNSNNLEKTYGFKTSDLNPAGTYVSGHPSLDKSFKNASIVFDKECVKIFEFPPQATGYILKSLIEKNVINNVQIEDASTIQNRVTVGRLLLTGIFAFAWKKKTKQECAYLVIEWKLGNFANETIFEFEGVGSIQKANTLRNKFINYLSTETKVVDSENNYGHLESVNSNQYSNYEQDLIYLDLLSKNRKLEAVNLFVHNNKVKIPVAMEYIQSLEKKS